MIERNEQSGMHRRRITLDDGRYLIFYTFDEATAPQAEAQSASESANRPEPEAEEERRV